VQAVTETAGVAFKLMPEFREQHLEIGDILRKFRPVEAGSISNPGTGGDGMQFHMTRGVTTTLEPTGHRSHT
jgi:hypothetical protein